MTSALKPPSEEGTFRAIAFISSRFCRKEGSLGIRGIRRGDRRDWFAHETQRGGRSEGKPLESNEGMGHREDGGIKVPGMFVVRGRLSAHSLGLRLTGIA